MRKRERDHRSQGKRESGDDCFFKTGKEGFTAHRKREKEGERERKGEKERERGRRGEKERMG